MARGWGPTWFESCVGPQIYFSGPPRRPLELLGGLWLNLSDIKKDRAFLLDTSLLPPGLFVDAMNNVVKRFQESKKQAEVFKRYLPRCPQYSGAAECEQPQSLSSSNRTQQKESVASHVHPQRSWGPGRHSQLSKKASA